MAGQRVLEIEQPEMADPVTPLDQHDVLGMIVAQHRHRPEAVVRDRLEHFAPRTHDSLCDRPQRRPPGNTSR